VAGKLANPGIGTLDPDEPVLRYVDLSTTHISEAIRLATPSWARTIVPGPRGAPLLYAGSRDGINSAVLATEAVEPGSPVELRIPAGAVGLTVTAPDGSVTELVPSSTDAGATAVTFATTDVPGVYTVTPTVDPTASPAPSASARPTTSVTPSGGPSASPVVDDPLAPVRFVVALFDVDESTISPGSPATIEALGSAPSGQPAPGSVERPTTRDELWVPIVLAILAFLCLEWALYHRDGLIRVRRSLATRLGRDAGSAT
jgi:hypothetical protein